MGPLAALVVPVIVKKMAETAALAVATTVAIYVTEKAMRAFESDENEGGN